MIGSINVPGAWAHSMMGRMDSVEEALENLSAGQGGSTSIVQVTIPKGRMRGDVNGDGVITEEDGELVKQYCAGIASLDDTSIWCGKVTGGAYLSISDAALISRYVAGTDDFPQEDYTHNWTYDSSTKVWTAEAAVPGLTAAMDAIVHVSGEWPEGTFSGATVLAGKLRVSSAHPPAEDAAAMLIYAPGNGRAVVVSNQRNGIGELLSRLSRAEAKIDSLTARLAEAIQEAGDAADAAATAQNTADTALQLARDAKTAADAALDKITEVTNSIGTVPSQRGNLTYSGTTQSPTWNNYNQSVLMIGGKTSAVDAGNYQATFTPQEGYQWADGTKTAKTVNWSIGRATVAVPAQSGSPTYTGAEQTASFSGYDSTKMTKGGTVNGTNAGTYNATFTPKANYQWPDSTTTAKTVQWSIEKAAGSLTLDKTSLNLNGSSLTGTITVTRAGDGAISATSSNTSVATVSVSGSTVTVTGKANGSTTITVKVAAGTNHTAPAAKTVSVSVTASHIYGASWDGSSTTKWTRTDDAADFVDPVPYTAGKTAAQCSSPFDNRLPWSGMTKSTRTGGVMVAIPKFWYKLVQNGKGLKVQIADRAVTGFVVSPAHMDRGDGKGERDVVYIGRYHCAINYKSVTGVKPEVTLTRATARNNIHALGSNIWQSDFAMRFTIWLLYIVEFADWNSQKTIGRGCGNDSEVGNMGYTDSIPYHTGTTQNSQDTYGLGTQYRNIEGLWDNVMDWCDGCYNNSNGMNIILNPNSFSDSSGGTCIGKPADGQPAGFTVSSTGGFPAFYSSKSGGSETTYSCDYWNFNASDQCVLIGGDCYHNDYHGIFSVYSTTDSSAGDEIGCRLQELP